ncbi:MAG: hypothetical protein AB7E80_02325 [Hyphomicrobiaceae bacterium]
MFKLLAGHLPVPAAELALVLASFASLSVLVAGPLGPVLPLQ